MPLITIGGSIIGGLFSSRSQRRAQDRQLAAQRASEQQQLALARESRDSQLAFQREAMDRSQFRGVGYRNSLGSVMWNGGTPTVFADHRLNQGAKEGMFIGLESMEQANARTMATPEELANDRYGRYLQFARPRQMQDFDALLGGQAANGQLGMRSSVTNSNTAIDSFARGIAEADYNNYNNAINQEQMLTDQLLARGRNAYQTAGLVNALGESPLQNSISIGQANANQAGVNLAGANASANNSFASTGINASQNSAAAMGLFAQQRANSDGALLRGISGGIQNAFGGSGNSGTNVSNYLRGLFSSGNLTESAGTNPLGPSAPPVY